MRSAQSLGGEARGKIQRQEALDRYNSNPVICKQCANVVPILPHQKVIWVRLKSFCNRSCAASFNNRKRKKTRPPKYCKKCLVSEIGYRFTYCKSCKDAALAASVALGLLTVRVPIGGSLGFRKKGELFTSRCNWQSARSSIRRHAAVTWKLSQKKLECSVCGYDKHAEIAHIKSVSEFPDDALISQINAIDNLIAFCPNHHWEFDNLQRGSETVS